MSGEFGFDYYQEIERFLRAIGPRLRRRVPIYAHQLSKRVHRAVIKRYQVMATPTGATGRAVERLGKEHGHFSGRPAKRPIAENQPMFLRIASNVKIIPAGRHAWRIHVDPAAVYPQPTLRYPRGVPLGFLAWVHENQKGAMVPITNLMLVYTRLIHEGRGGYGTRRRTKRSRLNRIRQRTIKGQLFLYPPQRPVWRYIVERQLIYLLKQTGDEIGAELMRMAVQYGGRPIPGGGGSPNAAMP